MLEEEDIRGTTTGGNIMTLNLDELDHGFLVYLLPEVLNIPQSQ